MDSTKKFKPFPPRHLTDDEVVHFTTKTSGETPVRIRIWRAADDRDNAGPRSWKPVVLASQVTEPRECMWPKPSLITSKVANYINALVLGYPADGLIYFEDEESEPGVMVLNHCIFEYFGRKHRLQFFKPVRVECPWSELEHVVRAGPVER